MFHEVIVPLIGMEDAVLVMISTPVDQFNFFSKLLELCDPDTGRPIFLVVNMELACKRCKDKGKPTRCTHRLKYLPPWKGKDKQSIMTIIMKDQETILARENFGIVTDAGNSYIKPAAIDRWVNMARFKPSPFQRADVVVLSLDLNGGTGTGTGSEMALVATAMATGERVVSFFDVYICWWFFVAVVCVWSPVLCACEGGSEKSVATPTVAMYSDRILRAKLSTDGLASTPCKKP